MSRVLRSTNIGAALRSRQRGFVMNPFRFGGAGGCAEDGFTWAGTTLDATDGINSSSSIIGAPDGSFLMTHRNGNNVRYVYTSFEDGTWTRRDLGANRDVRNQLYVAPDIWILPLGNAASSATTYRSTDNGVTWSPVTHGASGYWYGNAVIPGGSVIRYARYLSTETRVSTDQGASFSAGPAMPGSQPVRGMAYHAGKWYVWNTSNAVVYVLDEVAGTWDTWDQFTSDRLNTINPAGSKLFVVVESTKRPWVSHDNGATWEECTGTSSWENVRRTRIEYHPDGFWVAASRVDTAAPMLFWASVDGVAWSAMGTSVPIPTGYALGHEGFGIAGTFVAAGSSRSTTLSAFKGTC